MFQGFADYQAHSGQDSGSSFRQIVATNTDLPFWPEASPATQQLDATYRELLTKPLISIQGGAVLHQRLGERWTIYALLSGKFDANGLLNEPIRRQLTLLKSLGAQFHGNGLETVIAFRQGTEHGSVKEYLNNAISDLDFQNATFVAAPSEEKTSEEPLLLLVSPEGHVIKAWDGRVGAAELGIAVRQKLGTPAYSQIGESK